MVLLDSPTVELTTWTPSLTWLTFVICQQLISKKLWYGWLSFGDIIFFLILGDRVYVLKYR